MTDAVGTPMGSVQQTDDVSTCDSTRTDAVGTTAVTNGDAVGTLT